MKNRPLERRGNRVVMRSECSVSGCSMLWVFALCALAQSTAAAAAGTCRLPTVGPMHNASSCSNVGKCGTCTVTCDCGTGGLGCNGQSTLLRCLGADDTSRDLDAASWSFATCNATAAAPFGLVAPDRCGVYPCCPQQPTTPAGCSDKLDVRLGVTGQCASMIAGGAYTCESDFCPTCGILAGQCDKACRYGACAVCGDCFRESRSSVDAPHRCDDGNILDGDGCSSACEVEPGWTCTRAQVSAGELDRCVRCTNSPENWMDAQGYTCADYEYFGACDNHSRPTDPLALGGGRLNTPGYFKYQFVFDFEVRPGKPLELLISVKAASNAHIFIGTPQAQGFEAVIGGWNNALSVLRKYPYRQAFTQHYGEMLSQNQSKHFWLYYDYNGTFLVGRGSKLFADTFLDGSDMTKEAHSASGWFDNLTNKSSLQKVSITSGWYSTGEWELHMLSGSSRPTLADLASQPGLDALKACCVCGGGLTGRPCEQQASGILPGLRKPDIPGSTGTGRRLLAGPKPRGVGDFDGHPYFHGILGEQGFTLRIKLKGCETVSASCHLDGIVVPHRAKPQLVKLAEASHCKGASPNKTCEVWSLDQVWTQLRPLTCRMYNHRVTGSEHRWRASECGLTAGDEYVIAVQLKSFGGETPVLLIDLVAPSKPSQQVQSVDLKDVDPRPGFLAASALVHAPEDENDILQYRLYWGRANDTVVNHIQDDNAGVIAWINTFGGGGIRNGYDNACFLGDCKWHMELALSPGNGRAHGQHIIRQSETNECFCYDDQKPTIMECTPDLMSVDSPKEYHYPVVGAGALLDSRSQMYKTVQYRNIGKSAGKIDRASVLSTMESVCSDVSSCVGIMLADSLDAAIMYDHTFKFWKLENGDWAKPPMHPILIAAGAEQAWQTNELSEAAKPAQSMMTSLNIGDRVWRKWQAFRKETSAEDCLWSIQDRIVNGTVESRLVNSRFNECICQVPVDEVKVGEDGQPIPGKTETEMRIGKFCDSATFNFQVAGKDVRTLGYCEWVDHMDLPSESAAVEVDAKANDTGEANLTGSWEWNLEGGPAAWSLEGDGRLELLPTIMGSHYTLAAWVNLQGFEPASIKSGAIFALFNSTSPVGDAEPCFQVAQRTSLDGRAPYCTGEYLCNETDIDRCCGTVGGPTTITTTTSTTLENTTNFTIEPLPECTCSCAINITQDVEEEIGQPVRETDRWALGLRACGSEAVWDSGEDIVVPTSGNSGWVLLVAAAQGDSEGRGNTTFYMSLPEEPNVKVYKADFGCKTAGCTATAIFRDIPRDLDRTCVLTLSVWITNFRNGIDDADPEIIEVISVRGGAPQWSRDIRFNCHPGANNEPQKSFECVHKYVVDNWIHDLNSDRALRVDVRASVGVDEHPKNGDVLSGFAHLRCARITNADRTLPKSGAIRQVGKAARTCSGSTLQAIGGSTGAAAISGKPPVNLVSQAWVWHRRLSDAEIMSLHLGTRTRYYSDYQVELESRDVITPGEEVRSSGMMRCGQAGGCVASVTLSGLPVGSQAKCYLMVDVSITDFSSPTEVVEWIKIDDQVVVENCWPQKDDDSRNFYRCADQLDVSQTVMQSSFLTDGEAQISAKISPDVDEKAYRRDNKFYLYALVEIHCVGFGSPKTQLPAHAVKILPEVTHILTASRNNQGDGYVKPLQFYDTSNGFVGEARSGSASSQAVPVFLDAVYPEGMLWIYAVNRSTGHRLTKFDLINNINPDDEVCSRSHRRRGYLSVERFKADNYLTQCDFEPGIPYTILLYVDRKDPPYGFGELRRLDIMGPYPPVMDGKPILKARKLEFTDLHVRTEYVTGTVTITSAASEANITHYHLYYGKSGIRWGSRGRDSQPLAIIPATGAYQYSVFINNVKLPQYTTTFIVFCKNNVSEADVYTHVGILDVSMVLTSIPVVKRTEDDYLQVRMKLSSNLGARVDLALVPAGIEQLARMNGDYASLDFGPISKYIRCVAVKQFDRMDAVVNRMGPCGFVPGEQLALIIMVGSRSCTCSDPCYCTGLLSKTVLAAADGGFLHTPEGYMFLPDQVAPTLSLKCDDSCKRDRSLQMTGQLQDVGLSYPVLSFCAACLPPDTRFNEPQPPPLTCLRGGDNEAHQFWRMRVPAGKGCTSKTSLSITELEFFEISSLEPSGELAQHRRPIANVPELPGMDKKLAFDRSYASTYIADNIADTWLGIDMGTNPVAILRLRVHWLTAECTASEVFLEWSDNSFEWTPKLRAGETPPGQTYIDVFANSSAANWNYGANYQVSYNAEGKQMLSIGDVTPGTRYHIHCWSVDNEGNAGDLSTPFEVLSADRTGPTVNIRGISSSDFAVQLDLYLRDAGKNYPAMSTCVAREQQQGQSLPPLEDLLSGGQLCHYKMLQPAPDRNGRIPMHAVFKSRLGNQSSYIRLRQSQWGGAREDFRACGLRQEPMVGPGVCGALGKDMQPARFVFTIRAPEDIYLFLGEVGKMGYEILVGLYGGLRIAISRGYSRDPANENLPLPSHIMAYVHPNGDPVISPQLFTTFWFEADPRTGLIRLGSEDIIGHNVLLTHTDPFPISGLDVLMVGAGYWAAGPSRAILPEVYLCPAIGNLLLNRKIESSSVAFGGTPEKAIDGQWGDMNFCEYCAADDLKHVCASTRRQDLYNAPRFRIDMGYRYHIGAVRLVVPVDGRPEQARNINIYVGATGFRSDDLCANAADARGDHVWRCDPQRYTKGRWVSVWGDVRELEKLPEEFGLRICEVEAYVKQIDFTQLYYTKFKFDRGFGMEAPLAYNVSSQKVEIGGLHPNRNYEVFCYAEDNLGNLMYSSEDPKQVRTSDTTAPIIKILEIQPAELEIKARVHLEDPGDAYPATARCIATVNGRTPQEHEQYFEHRFWRMRFNQTSHTLGSECGGRILLRGMEFRSHGRIALTAPTWSSDPDAEEAIVGLDTDFDGVGDVPEVALWNLGGPSSLPWIAIDLGYKGETELRILNESGMLQGDLSVGIHWEGSADDLDLSVLGPGDAYTGMNLSYGDFYRVSDYGVYSVKCPPSMQDDAQGASAPGKVKCQIRKPVLATNFILALPGMYEVSVYRRDDWLGPPKDGKPWVDIKITVMTRICGKDRVWLYTLPADEHNATIMSDLKFSETGCHRRPGRNKLRAWQSSTLLNVPANKTMELLGDGDPSTCIETGGDGRNPKDPTPWYRISLAQTLHVKGVWLTGRVDPELGTATKVDIWVSPSTTRRVGNITLDWAALNAQGELYFACKCSSDAGFNNGKPFGMQAHCSVQNKVYMHFYDDCECKETLTIAAQADAESSPYTRPAGPMRGQTFKCDGCSEARVSDLYGCIGGVRAASNEYSWQLHPNKNCRPGSSTTDWSQGAVAHPCCPQNDYLIMTDIGRCESLCAVTPGCSCVTYRVSLQQCYLRHDCRPENCARHTDYISAVMPTTTTTTTTEALDIPDTAFLCAGDVTIGGAGAPLDPPRPIPCREVVDGSTVWVVAKPSGKPLILCELEVFTEAIRTVTEAAVDFGRANLTATICGAPNITVQYSDDNKSWYSAWVGGFDVSLTEQMQTVSWTWWRRMFALPFVTDFQNASEQIVTIPNLRENTTYDVMCWAEDSRGNAITQDLVALPLPWSESSLQEATDSANYPGAARRLAISAGMLEGVPGQGGAELMCNSRTREVIPCEEKVVVSDNIKPEILEAKIARVESTSDGYLFGATERITWQMKMKDTSCDMRSGGTAKCLVTCEVLDRDLPAGLDRQPGTACLGPRCATQIWSNGQVIVLVFALLRPGTEYTLGCNVSDPWDNLLSERLSMKVPKQTTPEPVITQPPLTSPPSARPPSTRPPTTSTRRPTDAPEEWWAPDPSLQVTQRPTSTSQAPMEPDRDTSTRSYQGRTLAPTTTTPTTSPPPSLPDWALNSPPRSGPLRAEMTLAVASQEEAHQLTDPSCVQALQKALRTSLGLTIRDRLEVISMDPVQGAAVGGQRRLAAWTVLVKLTIDVAGGAGYSQAVLIKMGEMANQPQSETRSSFTKEFVKQLRFWGMTLTPTLAGIKSLPESASWTQVKPSPSLAPRPAPGPWPGTGGSDFSAPAKPSPGVTPSSSSEAEDDKTPPWLIPVIISGVALLAILACGFGCALYSVRDAGKTGKVADVSTAARADSNRLSSLAAAEQHRQHQVQVMTQGSSSTGTSHASSSPERSVARAVERNSTRVLEKSSGRSAPRTSQRDRMPARTSLGGSLSSRSATARRETAGTPSKDDGAPVKEAWSTSQENAADSSRCSTASGNSKDKQDSLRASSLSSHPSSAREAFDPEEEVEILSYRSTTGQVMGSSPSRLPLHGQPSPVPPDLQSDGHDLLERPETSGTSATLN